MDATIWIGLFGVVASTVTALVALLNIACQAYFCLLMSQNVWRPSKYRSL